MITVRPAGPGDGPILHAMVRELALNHGHAQDFTAAAADYERFLADPQAINGALSNTPHRQTPHHTHTSNPHNTQGRQKAKP